MSTMIALFLVLSTLAGCASETLINVKTAAPAPPAAEYTVELESFEDSIRDEDGTVLANCSYQVPLLTAQGGGDQAEHVCDAFNEPFREWSGGSESLADGAKRDRAFYQENGLDFFPYTDQLRCEVYQTERLISVTGSYVTYTGGAHPNTILLSWNFDLENGAFFDAATLDDDAGFHAAVVQALRQQAADRARENGLSPREFFWEDYQDTLENWSSYAVSFDSEGMTVGFSPYELAAYAAGPQVFQIPYAELAGHLGEQGRALLGLD